MVNLAKLDFVALDITGNNYLTWVVDTKIHLEAWNLGETIKEENIASFQDRTKAMIFIHRHLDEGLKSEYLTVEDPLGLWKMKLYGETITDEDMLEKTFSTFHASNVLLQQQHREPEVNAASLEVNATSSGGNNHKRGCSHMRGRWNGKGKNHGVQFHNQVPRYDGNGNWACTCRTPKYLVDLYQASIKEKGVETNFLDHVKPIDIPDPVCYLSGQLNTTYLDVSDFIVERGNEVYRSD
ncbi:uncharacterized protein [Pyrus communis]|uniref:uncharacterized protein n=1 Tax=Pyrus communis TaxID=23211 RepID=UPI0035C05467